MNIKIKTSELTHDNLVDLLSTALYGSSWFGGDYDYEWYKEHCEVSDTDCLEDNMAKILLTGGKITICDMYAEDEDDFYGKLPHKWDDEYECMDYYITLKDIGKGLERAANKGYLKRVEMLANKPEQMDLWDADILLQCIVFGEYVYG